MPQTGKDSPSAHSAREYSIADRATSGIDAKPPGNSTPFSCGLKSLGSSESDERDASSRWWSETHKTQNTGRDSHSAAVALLAEYDNGTTWRCPARAPRAHRHRSLSRPLFLGRGSRGVQHRAHLHSGKTPAENATACHLDELDVGGRHVLLRVGGRRVLLGRPIRLQHDTDYRRVVRRNCAQHQRPGFNQHPDLWPRNEATVDHLFPFQLKRSSAYENKDTLFHMA